jgi:hypothetical protein
MLLDDVLVSRVEVGSLFAAAMIGTVIACLFVQKLVAPRSSPARAAETHVW